MIKTDQIRKRRLDGDWSFAVAEFLSSTSIDRCIAYCDLRVDTTHVLMIAKQNLIDPTAAVALLSHLHQYMNEGLPKAVFDPIHEDVHAGIVAQLIVDCDTDIGGRMHIDHNHNDEAATYLWMQTRVDILEILGDIASLCHALLDRATQHTRSIMPEFTHFQRTQPTTFAREAERLNAAFTGTSFSIDRDTTAAYFGFASLDFALKVFAMLSILMTNVSRLCEELILWSCAFNQFVELDDIYCSPCSIMPQKKILILQKLCEAKSALRPES
jgi:argininosuccinate lyase